MRAQTGEEDVVAKQLFDYVDDGYPEAPLILETLARAYMHNLRHSLAYACLSRWIEAEPDAARAYHWRGWVQERMGTSKEALDDYERALELDPNLAVVRVRVAEMFLEENRPEEALPHLEKLIKQFPERADVKARMGHCRLLQGRLQDARTLLEAAVQEMPDDLALLHNLARLEQYEQRYAEAEAWLRLALKQDPSDHEALYMLNTVLRNLGRTDEAVAVYALYEKKQKQLLRVNELLRAEGKHPSNNPKIYAELGSLLVALGREKIAMFWLTQALQLEPRNRVAHQALIEYYLQKGDHEKAAAHRAAIRETGTTPKAP
jgi:tetratricopeptide (TPR) repeat protein